MFARPFQGYASRPLVLLISLITTVLLAIHIFGKSLSKALRIHQTWAVEWLPSYPIIPLETVDPFTSELPFSSLAVELEARLLHMASKRREETHLDSKGNLEWNRKIFQTWREFKLDDLQRTWINMNPDWRYELFTNGQARSFVEEVYADVPEVLYVYDAFPLEILRADFFRILVLFAEGGIYSDIDTECLRAISNWPIDEAFWSDPSVQTILGVEIDIPTASNELLAEHHFHNRFGLVQWVLAARRYSPVLRRIIIAIITRFITTVNDQGFADRPNDVYITEDDVLFMTGPGVVSQMAELQAREELGKGFGFRNHASDLKEPKLFGSTLVLPITYFSPGVWHSNSKGYDDPHACVKHHYHGSWKGFGGTGNS